MKPVLITNNPKAFMACEEKLEVIFLEGKTYREVLEATRDALHRGGRLLSHPLAGSLKPNQTPYRSIIMDTSSQGIDAQSIAFIESSLASHETFMRGKGMPQWSEAIRLDFQTVDFSHVKRFIDKFQTSPEGNW